MRSVHLENEEPIWGLQVEIAREKTGPNNPQVYKMMFYKNGESQSDLFQRCLPGAKVIVAYPQKKNPYRERVVKPPGGVSKKIQSHYRLGTRANHEPAISYCWTVSQSQLNLLYNEKKVIFDEISKVMILDPDFFINEAPRGIYSFEWEKGDGPIAYAVDTSRISEWRDFKPEGELPIEVMIEGTLVPQQRFHILLSANSNQPSKEVYDALQKGSNPDIKIKVKIPDSATNSFVEKSLQIGLKDLKSRTASYFVLGAESLRMFRISIDNREGEHMYQITPYEENSEWSAQNSAVETSSTDEEMPITLPNASREDSASKVGDSDAKSN
ncbi:unnamed protein product [Albugo candida]|uniref:Uncharacterized protein n=1 Tax=Albugo candida TaxID=65357 RepID=A0A024GC79_9STRA|nr:unnamed protein product [Albugo candida]|eukprot:CCI43912.1 unnamed protein product [Albugo candida]